MSDGIKGLFQADAPSIPVPPRDLPRVIGDGRKRLMRRRAASVSSTVVIVGAIVVALTQIGENQDRAPVAPKPDESVVVEKMTEQERAEVFAFRALAYTGLMDPFGERSYNFTYADDTTRTDDGWRIGFAASDCEPREGTFTCRGLSGEEPDLGNALTDTYITVGLSDGQWRVVDVDGNMLEDERSRLIGYTLPEREEASHWEFPAVGVWSGDDGVQIMMTALWVGTYPTSAPGSVCKLQPLDDDNDPVGEPQLFYQEPPNRSFERAGWLRGTGIEPADIAHAVVDCHQHTGLGWEVSSGPELVGSPGQVSGVTAKLTWHGEHGFTSAAVCRATLVDGAGHQVWEGSGRVGPLWRTNELNNYPYRAQFFVSTGGKSVDAQAIGEFTCESE